MKGKSDIVRAYCEERGLECIDIPLTKDPVVLIVDDGGVGLAPIIDTFAKATEMEVIVVTNKEVIEIEDEMHKIIVTGAYSTNIADIIASAPQIIEMDEPEEEQPLPTKNKKKGKAPKDWEINRRGKR